MNTPRKSTGRPRSVGRHVAAAAVIGSIALAPVLFGSLGSRGPVPDAAASANPHPAIGPLPNRKKPDESLLALGKRLFFDPRVSGDGGVSCATCHDPEQGFAKRVDAKGASKALSNAYPGTEYFRNAPTLLNTVYKDGFADVGWGWDGRIGADMNDVIRDQITETTIMNMDMRLMQERLKQDPVYVELCAQALKAECTHGGARKAIEAFLETLVSTDAPFDTGTLPAAARRGRALFEGRAKCITCHNGPYFSDGKPHNTGVPERLEIFTNPVRHLTYRSVLHTHGVPKMHVWRRDVGYFLVSKHYADVGKFITPTLRELKYTAPYMHNGLHDTLDEVVEFYNQGGGHDDPLAEELTPLDLSAAEKKDLVAFLESLSSTTAMVVPPEDIPQEYEPIPDWVNVKN